MGTQTAIVKKIRQKRADYVLALKANQGSLLEDVREYFTDKELREKCAYKKGIEKARGNLEKREYWQTERHQLVKPEERMGRNKKHYHDP